MRRQGTRRAFLCVVVGVATAEAGCLGENEDDETPDEEHRTDAAIRLDDDRALTDVFPFELYDEDDELVAQIHWHGDGDGTAHWHNQPVEIPADGTGTFRIDVEDTRQEPIPLGADEVADTEWTVIDAVPEDVIDISVDGDRVTFAADGEGSAVVTLDFFYDDEHVWETPPLEVVAGDPDETLDWDDYVDEGNDHEDGDGDDGHDHGNGDDSGHDHEH